MKLLTIAVVLSATALLCAPASAAAVSASTLGCRTPADALKVAGFRAKKDTAGLATFGQTAAASRACIPLTKGVTVGIDEAKPPLSCVRLTGDLECYWVADALIDLYPGDKGAGGGKKGGGHHH
ncbi:hypothetical protein [Beijerinckia sp. L45]|uniref:hypothetical protein n=1 Tax=Beijerinckia sp. L45 TaxID=1641855 RepID=UPI00131C14B4|nr:hypothetical protein [Beijerinckia sp. L45]